MATKRQIIITLDDTEDTNSPTAVPQSLAATKQAKPEESTPSGIPTYEEETESTYRPSGKTTNIGRTFPDLISEFIGNPRAIAVILMFIPFPFFTSKIESIDSLKYPAIIGLLLNLIWFIFPLLTKRSSQVTKSK